VIWRNHKCRTLFSSQKIKIEAARNFWTLLWEQKMQLRISLQAVSLKISNLNLMKRNRERVWTEGLYGRKITLRNDKLESVSSLALYEGMR
jgi:hypothetical protein